MSQQTPYIGSQISLISRLDIRYEGVLFSVDTKESTITLSKVRSFGTETRPTANPVAPRTEVYEYIIFKATDIKDLIINDNKPKQTPPGQSLAYDPAIISVSSRPQNAPVIDALVSGEVRHGPHLAGGRGPQRGGFVQHLPTPGMLEPTGEKLRFETDYDFEKANEQFKETVDGIEKLDLTDKAKGDGPAEKSEAKEVSEEAKKEEQFYDKKSSFFDRISCESIEKQEGKEREMNQETFGSQAVRAFFRRGGTRFGYNGRPHGGYANRYMNNRGGYGQHYYGQQRRGGMAGYRQENLRQ